MHRLHVHSQILPKKLDAHETPEKCRVYLVRHYACETL